MDGPLVYLLSANGTFLLSLTNNFRTVVRTCLMWLSYGEPASLLSPLPAITAGKLPATIAESF